MLITNSPPDNVAPIAAAVPLATADMFIRRRSRGPVVSPAASARVIGCEAAHDRRRHDHEDHDANTHRQI
jgi:hypothetical protein